MGRSTDSDTAAPVWSENCRENFFHKYLLVEAGIARIEGRDWEALKYYRKAIDIMRRAQLIPSWVNTWEISIAKQRILSGLKETDQERLIEWYGANNLKICDGRNARHLGEIFLNSGKHPLDTAEDWIERAIKTDKNNGARWQLARDYTLRADLFKRKGDESGARESMKKASDIYEECGADGWVKKAERALEMHQ